MNKNDKKKPCSYLLVLIKQTQLVSGEEPVENKRSENFQIK